MSDNSSIEWCDATWNFLVGCDRVSPGCDECYAITTANIRQHNPNAKIATAFAGTVERRDGRIDWTGRVNVIRERLTLPLRWRKPRRVFVNSLSDLFHADVPDEVIGQAFAVMAATPQHTYQILTKRHGRMRSLLSSPQFAAAVYRAGTSARHMRADEAFVVDRAAHWVAANWPLRNVWLGVSVEDQRRADLRIPALMKTPAAVRWLSCEPLLGPVDLMMVDWDGATALTPLECWPTSIRWVVAGGESGPHARPMHPDWARKLRDQCNAAGVPFLFKQWGQFRPGGDAARPAVWINPDGSFDQSWEPTAGQTSMVKVGKHAAGRLLDGRTWDEYPAVVTA